MIENQEYFNFLFRTILERKKICYIQNHDQNKKWFMGIELSPFEFLIFSSEINKNYIVEIIGRLYPLEIKYSYMEKGYTYDILGEISPKKEQRRVELEHTLIWQNIFSKTGEFESILLFIYLFRDYTAEKEFKKRAGDNAFYIVNLTLKYKNIETELLNGAILAVKSSKYLEYVNENDIDWKDIKFKPGDALKYMKNPVEFIPELKM